MSALRKQATIVEIARRANTSTATVSRVLSGADYPVSDTLRAEVKRIAEEMHYVPNAIGQSLKIGKSNDIGVIIPNFSNPFYMQMISGIESVCRQRGYNPIFCSSNNDSQQELDNIELLRRKCVEGLILSSIRNDSRGAQMAMDLHRNVVLFDQKSAVDSCDCVVFDFEGGGYMAIRYLLEKGHRRIAFLSAPLEDRASRRAIFQGAKRAVDEWGGDVELTLITSDVSVKDYAVWEYENGRILAKKFLEIAPRPTAVFVYNDITALSVMTQLNAEGLHIPEDVSVIGFDNIINAEYTNPPLTTIRQPSFTTGAMATQIIFDKIGRNVTENCRVELKPQLIERKSVKAVSI